MRRASDVYEAEIVPVDHAQADAAQHVRAWFDGIADRFRRQPAVADEPVVANIVVIDLRSGAERVEISVTGAEISPTLARVHEDLDRLSVESFDEAWGVVY